MEGNDILTLGDVFGDIHSKRNITALVGTDLLAIDIHGGQIVHSADVQHHTSLDLLGSQGNAALIPDGIHEILVFHAGQLTFGAEGDVDDLGQLNGRIVHAAGFAAVAVVDLELPGAVQIHPVVTPELGLGMLGSVNHRSASLLK